MVKTGCFFISSWARRLAHREGMDGSIMFNTDAIFDNARIFSQTSFQSFSFFAFLFNILFNGHFQFENSMVNIQKDGI